MGLFGPIIGVAVILMVYFEIPPVTLTVMIITTILLGFIILVEVNFILNGDGLIKGDSNYKFAAHLYLYIIGIFLTIMKFLGGN